MNDYNGFDFEKDFPVVYRYEHTMYATSVSCTVFRWHSKMLRMPSVAQTLADRNAVL